MTNKKCEYSKIKPGDHLSEVQYYEVISVSPHAISVKNERGFPFDITADIVEEGMYSASQYSQEQKITRTELSEILENAGDTIFTANFNKQIKDKEVTDSILQMLEDEDLHDVKTLQKHLKQAIKGALQGEERTLVGYLIQTEPRMGRSQVIDLEASGTHRIRLIDHRTLNWLIIKNVKYIAK